MSRVREADVYERFGGSALDDLLGKASVATEHPRRAFRRINPTPRTREGYLGLLNLGLAVAVWGTAAYFYPIQLFVILASVSGFGFVAQALLLIAGPRAFGPIGQGVASVAAWIGLISLTCAAIGAVVAAVLAGLWLLKIVVVFVFKLLMFVLGVAVVVYVLQAIGKR